MTLGRISFMFSRSHRSTLLFPILFPSAPLTRASYHLPGTLRRDHRVIRPSPAPRLTLSASDHKSMFFSSRLRSIAVQRQFVSSQLHRMIFPLCDKIELFKRLRIKNTTSVLSTIKTNFNSRSISFQCKMKAA